MAAVALNARTFGARVRIQPNIMKKSTPKMVCSFSWRRIRDSTVYGAQKIIGCSRTNPRFFDRCTITASLFRPLDALGGNARRCSSSNSTYIMKKSTPKMVCSFSWRRTRDSCPLVVPKILSSLFTSQNFDHCAIIVLPSSATGGGRIQCPHLRCSSSNSMSINTKK